VTCIYMQTALGLGGVIILEHLLVLNSLSWQYAEVEIFSQKWYRVGLRSARAFRVDSATSCSIDSVAKAIICPCVER
jgi:hypothetical protein